MAGKVIAQGAEAVSHGINLVPVVALLAAGVIAVPLFKRLGLGSVLVYLAAGLLLGPSGFGSIRHPRAVLDSPEPGRVLSLSISGRDPAPPPPGRRRKPDWGLPDLDEVTSCAAAKGLALDHVIEMPANNLTVVFRKQ